MGNMRKRRVLKPNYQAKLVRMMARGELDVLPGQVIRINHEPACRIYDGKICNCDPEISLYPVVK